MELVLWDVILAAVAAVLVFVDSQEAAKQALLPAPSPSAIPTPTQPSEVPSPSARPATRRGPVRVKVDLLKQELERLSDEAEGKSPEETRRIYAKASVRLRASESWQRFMSREGERLLKAERGDGRRLVFRVRLQVAADRGARTWFETLAKQTPTDLIDLRQERAWVEARSKRGGDLNLSGFSPGQKTIEGRRCRVESWIGSREGTEVRNVVDATLAQISAVFGRDIPALRIGLLKEPGEPGAKVDLATYPRTGETEAERLERVRVLAAGWALERIHPGCQDRWSGRAMAEAFAGASLEAGGSRPTPFGRSVRAVASGAIPDGSGDHLAALFAEGPNAEGDPTGASAARLATFALVEREGRATRLWPALRAHAATGKAFPKSLRVGRLEQDWIAHERAP
ncbi:MAG: hypothetical protein JKY65_09715 [Planctomycetes bacterium]|nr:hypothetical protein [Planctomycetota bacterium]